MKIEMERVANSGMTLEQFADAHQLVMKVGERASAFCSDHNLRYHASFKHAEVSEPGVLVSTHGNGRTPEEAISAYAEQIKGQRLVIDAYTPQRREIQCPNEWA